MDDKKSHFWTNDLFDLFKDRKYHYGLGRRKSSTAQVRLYPKGKGKVYVNNLPINDYLSFETWQTIAQSPLLLTNKLDDMDVSIRVVGGGKKGQADAIKLGIARALITMDPDLRLTLKKVGHLTRDARVKERKKYGLRGARRAPQWSKR